MIDSQYSIFLNFYHVSTIACQAHPCEGKVSHASTKSFPPPSHMPNILKAEFDAGYELPAPQREIVNETVNTVENGVGPAPCIEKIAHLKR